MPTCDRCADRGLYKQLYRDDPDPESTWDVVVCGCPKGEVWKRRCNAGKDAPELWRAWIGREGVPVERVLIEELQVEPQGLSEADVIAAGRVERRKAKL